MRRLLRWLRIAFCVTWATACLLLVLLWVRSHWRVDVLAVKPPVLELTAWSVNGRFGFEKVSVSRKDWDLLKPWDLISEEANADTSLRPFPLEPQYLRLNIEYYHEESVMNVFMGGKQPYEHTLVKVPQYYPVAFTAILAGIPLIPWSFRFSLRTLLIATTLVAVVLGVIIFAVR